MTGLRNAKTSCHNCIFLDYHEKESYESSESDGYFCTGRSYSNESVEYRHLDKLNDPGYRAKAKRCCKKRGQK